ncbi:hypothetical protein PVAND_003207 [Polypedilum vanderplanki]|nr:hypothetical protein PVAND_003207 [Polypedilum vanderplanki]
MMKQWSNVEEKFLHSPYRKTDWKLSKKIKIVAVTVIILAFFEHLLYLANSAFNIYQDVVKNNLTVDEPLNHFLKSQFGYIYLDVPFSVPLGVFNEIMNMSFTFGWNYMELFVMMISLGLSTRFKQINERLKNFKEKILSEQQWSKIREDYSSLCNLVAIIDFDLRYLILLSNLNNVYFICFQLLNIFEKLPYVINTIYFWFSLIYLASRTFVAQFLAASIHESAKFPIQIISSIPHEGWCNEMQRFADQARAQDVALSGMKFFNLTRKSILSVIIFL